jgi:DNA-binding Xre family transcriptional regulator
MNLKKVLYQKGIRQVDLVKQLGVDPGRISLQINGIRPCTCGKKKK